MKQNPYVLGERYRRGMWATWCGMWVSLVRFVGFGLMVLGAVILLTYAFEPLRAFWPWLLALPLPVKLGFGVAAIGLVVLFSSLLWERWQDRAQDRSLLEDD